MVVPVQSNTSHQLAGLLVAGVSSRLRLDEQYRSFYELAAGQIATTIANARAYEEERRRADALAEIDRAKTAFFSNISHEFRTPITLLLGPMEEAAANPITPAPIRSHLELAHRNALRLLKLVNSLLDFSRIEAGRVQASYEPTDLAALTSDLASTFRSAMERAGLRLDVQTSDLGEEVLVDREMWEKIVLNLLSNAFKFTLEGSVAVRLLRDGTDAVLEIADTGAGIPDTELPRIFERFHRVEGAAGRTQEGSGIGLALVQELVKLHAGGIAVESALGQGTTFRVRIPFGTAHLPANRIKAARSLASTAIGAHAFVQEALRWIPDDPQSGARLQALEDEPVPAPGQRAAPCAGARILLADDNADMRGYVANLLSASYRIETVSDGQQALEAARRELPDLILSDIMMPRLDGLELLKALRSDESLRQVPVILLSARAGEEARVEGLDAGADDYLVKPFSARELLARVGARLELVRTRFVSEQSLRERERALREAHTELERRTAELARFNQAAVGRELRVIELKQEVNELRRRQGESARYSLAPEEQPQPAAAPCEPLGEGLVPLDIILRTDELRNRSSRPADHESEISALTSLVQALADSPRTILQTLADRTLEVLQAGSAGMSLLTRDGRRFYWAAIAVQWAPHSGGGTPRGFGPCGDVLDRNVPLLFTRWEHRYPYLAEATPLAEEALLVPFHVDGKAVGTIWVISHDAGRRFDAEDLRLLESLGRFASAAYRAVEYLGAIDQRTAALNLLEDAVQARQVAEESNRKLTQSEEALREADRRKDEFLALLGHELRNPIAPISAAGEVLSRVLDGDSRARFAVDVIKRQSAQLTRLVDDLLDIGRITQGRVQLRREPLDLATVVAQAVETVEPQLRQKQHRMSIISSYEPLYVSGDFTRLVQCLVNVLSNSIKYTDAHGSMRLETRAEDSAAVIEISDNGSGIAADLLPRVFDLFVQSDRTLDRAQGGLGIGLAVVKRLVEMHDGQVSARSAGLGCGSSFEIRLPRIARPAAKVDDIPVKSRPRRVLIVDDNADAAQSLSMLLTFGGHETQVALGSNEALERLESFQPEVALLDIGLPEINGYELAQRLRSMPSFHGIRLVAVTGYGQAEDRQRALASGFDEHLAKPVDLAALERLLAGKRVGKN
ncbi:MAG: ATP-binding protein [Steroidobacteraceae bacterium]